MKTSPVPAPSTGHFPHTIINQYIGAAAIALHYTAYNFVRIHKTQRVTPAMAAGVTDHVWELEGIVALLEVPEAASFKAT